MNGENDDVCLCGNGVKVMVVTSVEGRADAESTAVDVNEDREFSRGGGVRGKVETSSDAGVRVDCYVFGLNAG